MFSGKRTGATNTVNHTHTHHAGLGGGSSHSGEQRSGAKAQQLRRTWNTQHTSCQSVADGAAAQAKLSGAASAVLPGWRGVMRPAVPLWLSVCLLAWLLPNTSVTHLTTARLGGVGAHNNCTAARHRSRAGAAVRCAAAPAGLIDCAEEQQVACRRSDEMEAMKSNVREHPQHACEVGISRLLCVSIAEKVLDAVDRPSQNNRVAVWR